MPFKKEIEQSLEQIQILEECFRQARNSEILPISFFSNSYDIVRELAGTLHFIEQKQLHFMQEQFIANKISFLETTDLIPHSKNKNISQPENFNKEVKEALEEIKKTEEVKETGNIGETENSSKKTEEILSNLLSQSEEEQLKNSFFPESENGKGVKTGSETKILADTRKYISLNDKFRFQREIFMGSPEEMNKVFDIINEFSTIEDTWSFIETQSWNDDSEIVAEFKEFIEKRFS